jgi:hypothetical protein
VGVRLSMGQESQADKGASEVERGEDGGRVPVVADCEFPKGDDPRLRALHHPSEATESLAGVDARPSDAWGDAAPPQCLTGGAGGVGFIRMQLAWALAGPPRLAGRPADWPDRIDQRLQELRVVHVGGRELHRQGHTLPIHQEVVLATGFASICRVRASVLAAAFSTDADAVDAGTAPVNGVQVAQPVEDHLVHHGPDAEGLPVAQTAPAGNAATVAKLLGQITPSQALAQDEHDAAESGAVRYSRRTTVVAGWFGREERLDRLPEIVADGIRAGHRRA